ncbi:sugar phosphate isomerase/epimerase [Desertihabitans brevis]|uniref:Sugar phosphate isomerase/epimerase n=1 Tax=Desertihabitans brevis TaxID=2268447 RepID=A0A367YUA8_9ACTN|nr:sugar phosphate isomerase/epimerase [Desertihabitans brevis]RCK68561.1 sugar phosphate isomerase/epimerase [Desertihabitans brevis]
MNLSVQLYTVRELAQEDLAGTLQRLADLGFTRVEPYSFLSFGDALKPALEASGLVAPTTHQGFIGKSDAELEQVFAAATELGIGTVIDPHVPADRWQDAESVAATAEALNHAATIAAEHGIVVGYHNHAHEITPKIEGRTALEYFAGLLAEEVVLEVDAYWVAVGGEDPLQILANLGSRVVAVHIKDGPGTTENKDQVALGQGTQPVAEIVAATPGCLHVIELDDSRGDRFTAVADSYAFLASLDGGAA